MFRKHKILSLFLISILFLSTFLFAKIPINLSNLLSNLEGNYIPNDQNYQIKGLKINNYLFDYKISSNLEKIIESNPEELVEVLIRIENQFTQNHYDEIVDDSKNGPLSELRSLVYAKTKEINQPNIDKVSEAVINLDGNIISKSIILNTLLIEIPAKNLEILEKLPEIISIEKDFQIFTRLDDSVPTLTSYFGSDPAYQWNYSAYNGSGIVIGVVDTGIYKTHPALAGKIIAEQDFTGGSDPNDTDGHGTHVAGIIASGDSTYTGVAPGVDLVNIKCLNYAGEGNSFAVIDGIEWALVNNSFNISIITMSAGADVEANGTNGFACFVDYIVKYYKVLWINAAGNDGTSKSIDVPGDAYNGITVGNMQDKGNINRADDTLSSSSSRGPTWDIERIKPDITAPGTGIMSCNNGIGFVSKSGTSMATPHIAGECALLWQYYRENPISEISEDYYPMLIKSILMHTADDYGSTGPDYSHGYGYSNMVNANKFSKYGNALVDSFANYGSSVNKYKIEITEDCELNLSLYWQKDATYDINEHLYTGWQDNAITNLDLYLENANYQTLASSARPYDNFEKIEYNCSPGTYYIKIEVKNRALYTSPEEFMVISSAPMEKIFWVDSWTILFVILIVGSICAITILVIYYIKSRKGEKEEESLEYGSFSENPEYY